MYPLNDRQNTWNALADPWDIVIIGGGITGAGVLCAAAAAGLRALLLDAADFSFGTSSRSSKMVHGGFRYLRNRQYNVTYESVRQRQQLLAAAPHLVTPLRFLMPYYRRPVGRNLHLGVMVYDLMAPRWDHRARNPSQVLAQAPVRAEGLLGGYEYTDARLDDSRLVLRVIQEAVENGAAAFNYARVTGLLRNRGGQVCGVQVEDMAGSGATAEVQARVVVNAAGPWSDELRAHTGAPPRIRQQRGSHLVFSSDRLPLTQAVTLFHPRDNRAMFALPWEGAVILGTTDIDHTQDSAEPYTSSAEFEYMLEAARCTFPTLDLTEQDVIATYAGLRPIVTGGQGRDPSKESRAHVVWQEDGLLTVTGGKLTTYRIMARQALRAVAGRFPTRPVFELPGFDPLPDLTPPPDLDLTAFLNLLGRYGRRAPRLLAGARRDELHAIDDAPWLWAELRWAASSEAVQHLDDLLLRRVRLGLLLPGGGQEHFTRIRAIVQAELGWCDEHWEAEAARYLAIWQSYYSPAPTGAAPLQHTISNPIHLQTAHG